MIPAPAYVVVAFAGLSVFLAVGCSGDTPVEVQPLPTTTPVSPTPETTPLEPTPVGSEVPASSSAPETDTVEVVVGGVRYRAELAITTAQRVQGLSGRDSLPAGSGMLFVLGSPRRSSIWMKEMLFLLDIIWISEDCRVSEMVRNAPHSNPEAPDDVASYTSSLPAAYVLEVNAGDARRHGIEQGDRVQISGVPVDSNGEPLFTRECSG